MNETRKSLITIKNSPTKRTPTLDSYFRDLGKYGRITAEEEVELISAYRDGDVKAGEKIVTANLRFVVSVAKQFENVHVPLADLISAGNIGLIKALEKYDPTRGFKFISYAVWWIRQMVLMEIMNNGRAIRIPSNIMQANNRYRRAYGEDMPDIAKLNMYSLDHEYGEDAMTLADTIEDESFSPPDIMIYDKSMVQYAIDRLTPRERAVIMLRFGITDGRPRSYDDISMEMDYDLTRERIRQICNRALRKLKTQLVRVKPELLYETK